MYDGYSATNGGGSEYCYDQSQREQTGINLGMEYVAYPATTSEEVWRSGYSNQIVYTHTQPHHGGYQWNNQQSYVSDQRGLGSYVSGYHQDYPDINSLEPSLIPSGSDYSSYHSMMAGNGGMVYHNSPTGSSHTSTGSEESTEDFVSSFRLSGICPATVDR